LKRTLWLSSLALVTACATPADERSLQMANGTTVSYREVREGEPSAQPVAFQVLTHLAAGQIDEAARLSNEPVRRTEVLRDYLAIVGEAEFRRVYAQYLVPQNRVVAEIAMGPRRLIIWDLETAGHRLAGQYYIEADGKFLMDDRPGPERLALQRVLSEHRKNAKR
jgi:hypothetical protein